MSALWRETRPEGKTLSSTDTLENQSAPNPAEESHAHEGHDHAHDHDHEHAHGPVFNPECTRELVLDIPADEVAKSFKATVRTYQRYARIPGFRPGKVPESVVRRKFASEIRKEVIDALLPERFNAGVRELGIQPVGQPQVAELTIEEGQPLHVKAVFEYVPEFSIDGYKDVTVEKTPVEVSDEEFNREMDELRESRATIEPVEEDRALVDGDWAQITYTGAITDDPEADPLHLVARSPGNVRRSSAETGRVRKSSSSQSRPTCGRKYASTPATTSASAIPSPIVGSTTSRPPSRSNSGWRRRTSSMPTRPSVPARIVPT